MSLNSSQTSLRSHRFHIVVERDDDDDDEYLYGMFRAFYQRHEISWLESFRRCFFSSIPTRVLLIAQVALAQESATLESMTFHPSYAHQHVHTQYSICISPLLARSESDYLISAYTAGRGLDLKSSFSLITSRPLRGLIETTTLDGCVIKINCKYTLCSSSYTKLLHHDHWSPDHSASLCFFISNLLINIAVLLQAMQRCLNLLSGSSITQTTVTLTLTRRERARHVENSRKMLCLVSI